jgi:hypothetical protein
MPLRNLQEIIVNYAQHIYKVGRRLALQCSVDYPYRGPVFDFTLDGDRLEMIDNTQVKVMSQDSQEIMENIDHGRFDKPERNKVQAAFFKFEHWQNRILETQDHADPDNLERELEIMTRKLIPLAVEMLKSTAKSYSMPDPFSEGGQDYWTHPQCDLACHAGMLEAGDRVPAKIQLKVEQLNDLLREAERRVARTRVDKSLPDLSTPPEASRKVIRRLLQEIIVDCAGDMILAGKCKPSDSSGDAQHPPLPIQKNGTDLLPATGNPEPLTAADPAALKLSVSEDTNPYPDRRKKPERSRKQRSIPDRVAAERRKAVEAYIDEVFEKTGERITKIDFLRSAGYRNRTEFQRWQRNDPKTTKIANERFIRVLKGKPHLK